LLKATSEFDVGVPIVIRLVGTNEKEGQALLEGTDLIVVTSLEEGAQKAVEIAKG
jgi:succinyl-CoA synthetase beta subunit